MEEINQLQHDAMRAKASELYERNKKIRSMAFWEVRLTPNGFRHIEWKNQNHKRTPRESYVRYLCFLNIVHILNNSKLYQEYREWSELVEIKRHGKKVKERKIVHYYGFTAIVNNNKNRVKIVVKKVDGWSHYEFVSVIPAWRYNGYTNIVFFDENDADLEESNKKAILEDDCFVEVCTESMIVRESGTNPQTS